MDSNGRRGAQQASAHSRMRPGANARVRRALTAALLAGLAVSLLFVGLFWFLNNRSLIGNDTQRRRAVITPTMVALEGTLTKGIVQENLLPGTRDWMIPNGRAATVEIQGYAGAEYVAPGQSITFFVSTQYPGVQYTADIYRIGWYGGAGGRLLATMRETGQAQGYFDWDHERLIACVLCKADPVTHLLDANWQPAFSLTIPNDWITGLYVAKLTTSGGKEAYIHFSVTGTQSSDYLATMPDLTTAAYNDWGGYSLYHGPDQQLATRAFKVSLNRPALGWRFGDGAGFSQVLDAIRWLERNSYDVSYTSNLEISEHPSVLLLHRAFMSLGHDEYWTLPMRNAVEQARDRGMGLAFLGANAAYWNVRLESDRYGRADRTVVCYKSAKLDPLFGRDNANVTVEWRQPPLLRPENALVGVMYAGWVIPPKAWPWYPTGHDALDLLNGTGLRTGASYGCNIVGYEWDTTFDNGAAPPGLQIVADSPTVAQEGYASESKTAYYVAKSGAFVFASGSIYFSYALDDLHVWDVPHVPASDTCLTTTRSAAIPGIQTLLAHVMSQLLINHRSVPHGTLHAHQ